MIRKEQPFAGLHVCPASSLDVPDEQSARLVILRTKDTYKRNKDDSEAIKSVENILNTRGTAPRIYRNMLAFVAPDYDQLKSLTVEVKRYLAWTSIKNDKDDLNLDGGQIRETENNLRRSNDTVDLRLKETYCWLMVPYIDRYTDMKTIQWEINNIGGGNESIVSKAARKMEQNEQIISKWAPALLKMDLDDLLWKDYNDISIKKLWEYLTTYCYLPRLANYGVLQETIIRGVDSQDYFALAGGYEGNRYMDLKYNKNVFSINPSDLLVKTEVALKQLVDTPVTPVTPVTPPVNPVDPPVNPVNPPVNPVDPPVKPMNTHFYMSTKVDNTRINRDVNNYVQEIIQHLSAVDGAELSIRLEVEVVAKDGIPSNTVRTVSENCRTLKVDDFSFDN